MSVKISRKSPRQILTRTGGYLTGYSYTLNPYAGCAFACSYCYVRRMPVALFRGEEWGSWVDIKEGAAQSLRRELAAARKKGPVSIFMSSSTDPYQPVEYKEGLTRSLLEVMAEAGENRPDFLLVQTRSPLVTRDIDLFLKLGERVRVSVTVETDLEEMRRTFTPAAPPIAARLNALRALAEAGVPAQATVSPVLPSSPEFAAKLAGVVQQVCIDDFFMGDGSMGKRTAKLNIRLLYERVGMTEWYSPEAWRKVYERLKISFPEERLRISQQGFMP